MALLSFQTMGALVNRRQRQKKKLPLHQIIVNAIMSQHPMAYFLLCRNRLTLTTGGPDV